MVVAVVVTSFLLPPTPPSGHRTSLAAPLRALRHPGLLTVALGLLAFDIAGDAAGSVLGTALTIKMAMYVVVAPIVGAYADRLPRRMFLTLLDVARAAGLDHVLGSTGSTSSSGIGSRASRSKSNSPRRVPPSRESRSTSSEYFWKISARPVLVACCSRKMVSGENRCSSPSRRYWYSPPTSSRR